LVVWKEPFQQVAALAWAPAAAVVAEWWDS
jgi:hypothetical protein